ncbi:unnamed protein product [Periconia digitata]|uniref:Uncharacterized protein n=1 Tax=Periconia digitata TaxID=1303443 RepID=A0A9W4USW1_9PLEO|nr:unnamed protein product [Periconia digitata]
MLHWIVVIIRDNVQNLHPDLPSLFPVPSAHDSLVFFPRAASCLNSRNAVRSVC